MPFGVIFEHTDHENTERPNCDVIGLVDTETRQMAPRRVS